MKASLGHCVVLVAVVALSGCGKGREETPPEAATPPQRVAATPRTTAATTPPATGSPSTEASPTGAAAAPTAAPRQSERRPASYDEEAVRETRRSRPQPAREGVSHKPRSSITVPSAVIARDRVIPPGHYEVKLEDSPEGLVTSLVQNGEVAGKELAIHSADPAPAGGNGSWTWVDRREEPLLRVYTARDGEVYFAVFPIL